MPESAEFFRTDDRDSTLRVDPDLFRQVDQLKNEIDDLKARVKELTLRREALMAQLVDQFVRAGVHELNIDGRKGSLHDGIGQLTLAKRDDGVTTEHVLAALRAAGLEHRISETYHAGSLSAWARDELRAGRALPAALLELFEVRTDPYVGFTAGAASRRRDALTPAARAALVAAGASTD